jgi:transposase
MGMTKPTSKPKSKPKPRDPNKPKFRVGKQVQVKAAHPSLAGHYGAVEKISEVGAIYEVRLGSGELVTLEQSDLKPAKVCKVCSKPKCKEQQTGVSKFEIVGIELPWLKADASTKEGAKEHWLEFKRRFGIMNHLEPQMLNAGMLGLSASLVEHERKGLPRKKFEASIQKAYSTYLQPEADKLRAYYVASGETSAVEIVDDLPTGWIQKQEREVISKFTQWKNKPGEAIPQYRKNQPLSFRDKDMELRVENGTAVLYLKLTAGRSPRARLRLKPDSGAGYHALGLLRTGKAKTGGIKLTKRRKRDGNGKKVTHYQVSLTDTRHKSPSIVPKKGFKIVVRPGTYNLATILANDGKTVRFINGNDIKARKQRIRGQRAEIQSGRRLRGGGARGHGHKRFIEAETRLRDRERNLVTTLCQQVAAFIVKLALQIGAEIVYWAGEDSEREAGDPQYWVQMPWHELKNAIERACEKEGIEFDDKRCIGIEDEDYRCCNCGNEDRSQAAIRRNFATGQLRRTFHCKVCKWVRPVDQVTTINAAMRAGVDMSAWHETLKYLSEQAKEIQNAQENPDGDPEPGDGLRVSFD